jgi:hypothetical protein
VSALLAETSRCDAAPWVHMVTIWETSECDSCTVLSFIKPLSAHKYPHTGLGGAIIPGSLCASLFPAIIGTAFPGALYLSQTLKFRNPALVSIHAASCSALQGYCTNLTVQV